MCSIFFIDQYIPVCVLLPAELLTAFDKKVDCVSKYQFQRQTEKSMIQKYRGLHFKEVLIPAYNNCLVFVVRMYDTRYRICQHRFSPKLHSSVNIPQPELWRVFQKFSRVPPYVQSRGWPFLTMVVTRINMRNVFYYKPSKNAHFSKQAQLNLTHSM